MTITRIASLGRLPEGVFLKPVNLNMKCSQVKRLARNPDRLVFYYRRRVTKFPALMYEVIPITEEQPADSAPAPVPTAKAEEVVQGTLAANLQQLDLFAKGNQWHIQSSLA